MTIIILGPVVSSNCLQIMVFWETMGSLKQSYLHNDDVNKEECSVLVGTQFDHKLYIVIQITLVRHIVQHYIQKTIIDEQS